MLVTRIMGDCPGCRGKNRFGNVSVSGDQVLRGCTSCKYSTTILLPKIRKKIIYLDQFFFSHAFRNKEQRFVDAIRRIRHLSDLQLLVAPLSSVHEEETHQWRYGKDLLDFIKATSCGHEFKPAYDVEETQIIKAFQLFLAGSSPELILEDCDAIEGNVHEWNNYFRIDIPRYIGDIEEIRNLNRQSVEELVNTFEDWRKSTNTFDQDVALELRDAGKIYIDSYLKYATRIVNGDYDALLDSPVMSGIVKTMLCCFPTETPPEEHWKQVIRFFISDNFAQLPYQLLSTRMFAKLKDMVKNGAYTNSVSALKRLNGFFFDIKHIATYAPYCNALVIDKPMAALVTDPRVGIEKRYGIKVFSLNNWSELIDWLNAIEAGITEEHRAGLSIAYPPLT